MEGWPEAREINTEGWELQETVRAGDSGGKKLGLPGLSSTETWGMGPGLLTLECVRILFPTQGKWSGGWGVSLPGSAPEPRWEDAVVQKVPGLGRSCPAGRRGRAGRCPSV